MLNADQQHACSIISGPVCCFAGPGSGKTRTIVHRAATMIDAGIAPHQILTLTFTNNAAKEVSTRIADLIGDDAQYTNVSTFHAYAVRQLAAHGATIGLERWSILDESEQRKLMTALKKDCGIVAEEFPPVRDIIGMFSASVNKENPLPESIPKEHRNFSTQLQKLFERYSEEKAKRNVLDYDDILVKFLHLCEMAEPLRRRFSHDAEYIQVDEFQDTNALQLRILQHLTCTHDNIFIVGDEMQGIYGFRGANPENITTFLQWFPQAEQIHLSINYRSTPQIVEFGNALRARADTHTYVMTSVKPDYHFEVVRHDLKTLYDESRWVVEKLLELRAELGLYLEEFAILYRNSYHARLVEQELLKRRLPYVKFGGQRVQESEPVKDLLAFYKLLVNPSDAFSFRRIVKLLPGIGDKTADNLFLHFDGSFDRCTAPKKAVDGMAELRQTWSALHLSLTPVDVFNAVWGVYRQFYLAKRGEARSLWDAQILSFREIAEQYADIEEFLFAFALATPEHVEDIEGKITLSTIHSFKGMERACVFVMHLTQGALPSYRETSRDEEERLFYVACTRAESLLFLSTHQYDDDRACEPSEFLNGLDV